eukprot:2406714-Prymnesium_polylepis.1
MSAKALVYCCALLLGVGQAEARVSVRPSLSFRAHRTSGASERLQALRGGGGRAPDVGVPVPPAKEKSGGSLLGYLVCAAIVVTWISTATLVFSYNENWPLAQSLFYAVDTGMSIGFGAVAEKKLSTKAFTIIHVLLGASAVGGAIALFAESVVESSPTLASD